VPTFNVDVYRTVEQSGGIEVEAATEAEAREIALDRIAEISYWLTDAVLDSRTENVECVSADCEAAA
jgi:hypothetical protein